MSLALPEPDPADAQPAPLRRAAAAPAALGFVLVLAGVLLACGRTVLHHASVARDPACINDDARILIVPFLRYHDPRLFQDDYVMRYLQDTLPLGYEAAMILASKAADPRVVSKVAPYPLLLALVVIVGLAARKLAGLGAAAVAMALVLTSELYIERMTGTLPRMFAFPLVAFAALALAYGRTYWLCGAVVVGALLYPSAALVCGLVLTALLLLVPAKDRGDASAWSLRKRLAVLAVTAGASAVLIAPTAWRLRPYGAAIRPGQVEAYPEIGPQGRFGKRDRPPFRLLVQVRQALNDTFTGPRNRAALSTLAEETAPAAAPSTAPVVLPASHRYRVLACAALAAVAGLALAWKTSAGRRLLALGVAAVVGHTLANAVLPHFYLPQRYTSYTIPLYVALALPAGLVVILRRVLPAPGMRVARASLFALICVPVLAAMGVGVPTEAGLSLTTRASLPVMNFLETLPPGAMLAGWPRGMFEDVSYVTGRRAFLTFETHPTFHKTYTDRMRQRTWALMDAYFATDLEPLLRLRDQHGVTHLVIDRGHYETPPVYFEPFAAGIPQRFEAAKRNGPEALRRPNAVVYDDGTYLVLELARLRTG